MAKEFLAQDGPHDSTMGESPEVLASENETLREDAETYQNRIEDLKDQVERLQREAAAHKSMIAALQRNGGEHWFRYGYQKVTNVMLGKWEDHCKVCDQPREAPCHFAVGVKPIDQADLEKKVQEARGRVMDLLGGMGMGPTTAMTTAIELLKDLPGVTGFQPMAKDLYGRTPEEQAEAFAKEPEDKPVKGINTNPRICNACGLPEDNHNVRHPFSWGTTPR